MATGKLCAVPSVYLNVYVAWLKLLTHRYLKFSSLRLLQLTVKMDKRITAVDALKYISPFVESRQEAHSTQHRRQTLDRMKAFHAKSQLKQKLERMAAARRRSAHESNEAL